MRYAVSFSPEAEDDLQRLVDYLIQRELDSETSDPGVVDRALKAIEDGVALLETSPFSCRKAGNNAFVRELIIRFGSAGYVALFEIVGDNAVIVGALRHQREDDYL